MPLITQEKTEASRQTGAHWGGVPADAATLPLEASEFTALLQDTPTPFVVVRLPDGVLAATRSLPDPHENGEALPAVALGLPVRASQLGDPTFRNDYGVKYAYYGGAMANGIASEELVEALANAGLLGIFGAAGLSLDRVTQAIDRLQSSLPDLPFGCNLIHSPNEQDLEAAVVQLYLDKGVKLAEASAFLDLTPHVVRYRVHGIHEDENGAVITPNRLIAKVSRVEVATKFLSPPPATMLEKLVAAGHLTKAQAQLAARIPMCDDLTAEADSGGHTDNRPAIALLPAMIALRDRIQAEHRYAKAPRVGLAGGISTPHAAAAAFAMGAAYVVTGTVNQACVESGSSDLVRQMLAEAEQADTAMAPAADMFEMGVEVQVLKRGTMFSMRAAKLYELYRRHKSIDELPAADRDKLEKQYFRKSIAEEWASTKAFFAERDPKQIARAEQEPRHKMALLFRSYLGQASIWANRGEASRKIDYQVWCGPAMGAFNEWVRGSFLEDPKRREVATVVLNILHGAAVVQRYTSLTSQGVPIPGACGQYRPLDRSKLEEVVQ